VVAGWGAALQPRTLLRFAEVTGWPVLADPISNLRVPGTISTYDPLLRAAAFAATHRPDVVLRVGGPLTNKISMQWLDSDIGQVLVTPTARFDPPCGEWADAGRRRAASTPSRRRGTTIDGAWCDDWLDLAPAALRRRSSTAGTAI
jgi:2-succinyl-5-enolpyruvyl-6-hydroxy-3-cyclohexene-1-carboxylate synthase